jgi:hypothetical protein
MKVHLAPTYLTALFLVAGITSAACADGGASLDYPLRLADTPPAGLVNDPAPFRCPSPTAAMTDMSKLLTFYQAGATQSVVDKQKMATYVSRTKLVDGTSAKLRAMVARALSSPAVRPAVGACIMRQVRLWADRKALLGNLDDNQPKDRRQGILIGVWNTSAFTDAYAVATQAKTVTQDQRSSVQTWFAAFSDAIIAEFTPPAQPRRKEDLWLDSDANTRYWAAGSVGLLAVSLQDRKKFDWAMAGLRSGLSHVGDDGGFPLELARGAKALHYQSFAMRALTVLVALADANGVVLSPEDEARLVLATRFTVEMYNHPEILEKRLGYPQEPPKIGDWLTVLAPHIRRADPALADEMEQIFAPDKPITSAYVLGLTAGR